MDFLRSTISNIRSVGSGYTLLEYWPADKQPALWKVRSAVRNADATPCTVWLFEGADAKRTRMAQNAVKRLRTISHPSIVKYYDSTESSATIQLVTERVYPAETQGQSPESLLLGISQITKALDHLNSNNIVHANICLPSIVASESGLWKIAGCELMASVTDFDVTSHAAALQLLHHDSYVPPESAHVSVTDTLVVCIDSYGLATLIYETFSGIPPAGPAALVNAPAVPSSLKQLLAQIGHPQIQRRRPVRAFLKAAERTAFASPLIAFVESLDVPPPYQNLDDWTHIIDEYVSYATQLPAGFAQAKILPALLSLVANATTLQPSVFVAITDIVVASQSINEAQFDRDIAPAYVKGFSMRDRTIRLSLLEALPRIIDRFKQRTVADRIFYSFITGFSDSAPAIREMTVRSVVALATKLNDRQLNGDLLRHLARCQSDPEPPIRTNTIICLEKIASYLNKSSRPKVLANAFGKALRDPFPRARLAAVLSFKEVAEYFSPNDVAELVLPALSSALLDKDAKIRANVKSVFELYYRKVLDHSETLPDISELDAPALGSAKATDSVSTTPQSETAGFWSTFATSSISKGIGMISGDISDTNSEAGLRSETSTPFSSRPPLRQAASALSIESDRSYSATPKEPTESLARKTGGLSLKPSKRADKLKKEDLLPKKKTISLDEKIDDDDSSAWDDAWE
ncbi:hypothetical protein CANCADRAFT_4409 [Tortispora caseinolytica NRRL Y-17796]|uniref:Protein kinase domain-containing protein n=1 Tax=Tortispora caseinolytica NRRL Y-17796 TaxID=767744 RepID=A0A1E4TDK3_9ASCO|nr:hypothetical protein CANCADRAFT_4409 [Tortispora caseinolytica NRRL Y-17796]